MQTKLINIKDTENATVTINPLYVCNTRLPQETGNGHIVLANETFIEVPRNDMVKFNEQWRSIVEGV